MRVGEGVLDPLQGNHVPATACPPYPEIIPSIWRGCVPVLVDAQPGDVPGPQGLPRAQELAYASPVLRSQRRSGVRGATSSPPLRRRRPALHRRLGPAERWLEISSSHILPCHCGAVAPSSVGKPTPPPPRLVQRGVGDGESRTSGTGPMPVSMGGRPCWRSRAPTFLPAGASVGDPGITPDTRSPPTGTTARDTGAPLPQGDLFSKTSFPPTGTAARGVADLSPWGFGGHPPHREKLPRSGSGSLFSGGIPAPGTP